MGANSWVLRGLQLLRYRNHVEGWSSRNLTIYRHPLQPTGLLYAMNPFTRAPVSSRQGTLENAGNGRTVATREQRAILTALHERSRGRVTKEDVELVSIQTGLYVADTRWSVLTIAHLFATCRDPKWIRKWVSRRRCRTKVGTRSSSSYSQSRMDLPADVGSASTDCPSILPLLGNFLVGPACVTRPDYGRSVSAPNFPTMHFAAQFDHSTLGAFPPGRPATTAPVIAHDVDVFLAPPTALSETPFSDTSYISMLFSDPSSDSIIGMDMDRPTELAYPSMDEPPAKPDEAPTDNNILTLIDCLQQFAGSPDPFTTPGPESRIHMNLSAAQSDMLSALGLELATPSPEQAARLALENAGPVILPVPAQSVPISFQIRLSDLFPRVEKALRPEASLEGSLTGDFSLGTLATMFHSGGFSPLMRHIEMATPELSSSTHDEESEDEDEAVTPGETNMMMILPDLRKHSASPLPTIAIADAVV
ncbi:hypothetical protein PHLGIDRAFT_307530 [Phlebiopsis gigantea 11061_1 CR5-6]|uniref:Uncharacterized protein n=1 Tax=Phlebiopsis gigantea (strain 11061_1 CR5-6) TaxID=745531 RepID=A0A0C3SB15_PHLG1|nr:hypothetical protein PHLGIDRAFT_307530 [Phlebiopsis gigantea 11061_1 CR5-6]